MGTITSHRELIVWQKSMDLAVLVYQLSQKFPSNELYRVVSQMTRSAASVPANIAEGHARGSRKDYSHFLSIAKGSLMETETYLMPLSPTELHQQSGSRFRIRHDHRNQQDDYVTQVATSR